MTARSKIISTTFLFGLLAVLSASAVFAQLEGNSAAAGTVESSANAILNSSGNQVSTAAMPIPAAPGLAAKSYMLIDYNTCLLYTSDAADE